MRFSLGINYWPSQSAMAWWRRFDATEVERDFARIRAAGFDSVRIFLLWEDFQPAPDRVASEAIARLLATADIAASNSLSLIPTLFTGHMSGVNWIPAWALDDGLSPARFPVVSGGEMSRRPLKNWYTESSVIEAQALLAREVASALCDHPALWCWDLGNENSNCTIPPSREAGIAWLECMAGAIRSVDPNHPVTIGLHQEDLEQDRRIGPAEAARVCDFLCMHGYPMYLDWAEGATDVMVLPFLGLITRWLAGPWLVSGDVLFEEFGAPAVARNHAEALARASASGIPILDEQQAAIFVRQALDALHRFGFMGAMLWCFSDYPESLWQTPPFNVAAHEPFFGLWRSDGSAKPALEEIRRLAAMGGRERIRPVDDFNWIDIDRDAFYANPKHNLRWLYRRFRDHASASGGK